MKQYILIHNILQDDQENLFVKIPQIIEHHLTLTLVLQKVIETDLRRTESPNLLQGDLTSSQQRSNSAGRKR